MSLDATMLEMGRRARGAADALRTATAATRSAALSAMAVALRDRSDAILSANAADVERARAKGVSEALIDRLSLSPARIAAMAGAVEEVA
ncbi:MAG: gamma-glutamyl-phosphate reductase, partial [Phenylobacterium zucineum]